MRRSVVLVLLVVMVMTLGLAAPAMAGQFGVGPCTGGTPVALGTPPGAELGAVTSSYAADPESNGFGSAAEVVAFVHANFCASNTPGG